MCCIVLQLVCVDISCFDVCDDALFCGFAWDVGSAHQGEWEQVLWGREPGQTPGDRGRVKGAELDYISLKLLHLSHLFMHRYRSVRSQNLDLILCSLCWLWFLHLSFRLAHRYLPEQVVGSSQQWRGEGGVGSCAAADLTSFVLLVFAWIWFSLLGLGFMLPFCKINSTYSCLRICFFSVMFSVPNNILCYIGQQFVFWNKQKLIHILNNSMHILLL